MGRLKFDLLSLDFLAIAAPFVFVAVFALASSSAAPPPQAPPVRKCLCPDCTCETCTCTGECDCPTCKSRLQVQPSGNPGELPRVLLFTASWCGPCRTQHSIWDRVSAQYPGLMAEVDLDANKDLATRYGVTSIPCVVTVEGEKFMRHPAGVIAEAKLRAIARKASGP